MGRHRPAAVALAVLLSCLVCDAARGQEELELKFRQAGMAAYGSGNYSLAARDFRVARFLSLQAPARHLEILARLALAEDAAGTAASRDATLERFLLVEARFPEYTGASLEPDARSRFHSLLMKRIPRDRLLAVPPLAAELGLIPMIPTRQRPSPSPPPATPTPTAPPEPTKTPAPSEESLSRIPSPSPAPTNTPTPPATNTPTTIPPTTTATVTPNPTATATARPLATATPTSTATPTTNPTKTATSTRTATLTATATPTATPRPPATFTATASRTATLTATATRTLTSPPTSTSTPRPSATPSATATQTATATRTPTLTASRTATPLPPTATATATRTPTATPTSTATATPRSTATETATPRPSPPAPAPFVAPKSVDTPPRPIERILPVYPERALKERVRGEVILRALVSETGLAVQATVEKGVRADLNAAAVSAALQWRFEPARKNGRAVRTYATIRFSFEGVQFARTPFPLVGSPTHPAITATPTRKPARSEEHWRDRTPRPD